MYVLNEHFRQKVEEAEATTPTSEEDFVKENEIEVSMRRIDEEENEEEPQEIIAQAPVLSRVRRTSTYRK